MSGPEESSVMFAALHGLSVWVPSTSSFGLGRESLGRASGRGGQRYTRSDPLADEVTRKTASSVSLILVISTVRIDQSKTTSLVLDVMSIQVI